MDLGNAPQSLKRKPQAMIVPSWVASAGLPPALVASAIVMAMSVGAPGNAWLAWVGLLPLLAAVRILSPLAGGLAGAAWGLCFYAAAVSGIAPSITPGVGSLVLLAIVPAAYAALGSLATRAVGFAPVILALLWILAEVALQPLGLRSGLLASTQEGGHLASYLGGLLGYVFVASAIVYANAFLLSFISRVRVALPGEPAFGVFPFAGRCGILCAARPARRSAFTLGYPRGPPS